MKRWKPNQRKVKRHFSRSAARVHRKNVAAGPMRGGIRL